MLPFRPGSGQERRHNGSHFSSPSTTKARRRPKIIFDDTRRVQASIDDEDSNDGSVQMEQDEDLGAEDDASENDELAPLLPIFESSHLDTLPVYNLTHAIRLLVVPRCETTLTWDQLRSPQVSQFMIKPIQKNIITAHFSKATLYALLSNCLQFAKEAADNPGNAGTSRTRAMVCELLAIRLLKEYSIRELIDALSYDFYPLQGLSTGSDAAATPRHWDVPQWTKQQARTARVSTLEIAIRAEAKRFLAHPVVVQQLEAIWAGVIVFHSAADSAHRAKAKPVGPASSYGAIGGSREHGKPRTVATAGPLPSRKTVTIYNPSEASLFKLSRLRVPRYRSFFSTLSLAILLGLFVAILVEKSIDITALEIVFWFWSAGFMLDEVVGLTDQGFNLYLLSFWNAFDIGILFILVIFYCLRLYGLVIADESRKEIAGYAYDVLGLNAILMFPRLFSVLDHYRYFSQLLIAFRIMARDLVAVLVLIGISCSGFFVAFTLAFGNETEGPKDIGYALFQLIMGFTPAAWERWARYNRLGQGVLVLFLFITHFLVVTILITVLTNSFMSIVQNANDEHQFVFAINTISMVKSDALFAYVAPSNIIAWLFTPLRSCLPFRTYVWLNRTIIKITHFPILWSICGYERLVLKRSVYEPTDLIERRGRLRDAEQDGLFTSRTLRVRERSIATMFQDKALDAVFQRPLHRSASRLTKETGQMSARPDPVDSWMLQMDQDGPTGPPAEQDRGIVDRLEHRRGGYRSFTPRRSGLRNFTTTMSVLSDPEDFIHTSREPNTAMPTFADNEWQDAGAEDGPGEAENDGDDELLTNDGADIASPESRRPGTKSPGIQDYFQTITPADARHRQPSNANSQAASVTRDNNSAAQIRLPDSKSTTRVSTRPSTRPTSRGPIARSRTHDRTVSSNTILYNPLEHNKGSSTNISQNPMAKMKENNLTTRTSTPPNETSGGTSPSSKKPVKHRRPLLNERMNFLSTPNFAGFPRESPRDIRGQRSPYNFDLVSDLGDNKAPAGGYLAGMPASFGTHMDFMARSTGDDNEEQRRMGKLMLARMNTLEQGFREVIKEVKDLRRGDSATGSFDSYKSSILAIPSNTRMRIRERDAKPTRPLGRKRREGEWVEEITAEPSSMNNDVETGERGSSI